MAPVIGDDGGLWYRIDVPPGSNAIFVQTDVGNATAVIFSQRFLVTVGGTTETAAADESVGIDGISVEPGKSITLPALNPWWMRPATDVTHTVNVNAIAVL